MSAFIHFSDPHLSSLAGVPFRELLSKRLLSYLSWLHRRRFDHLRSVLDALLADIGPTADPIIITGDLTHASAPQEFRQTADWLAQVGPPRQVALIPGNHDALVKMPWAAGLGLWEKYLTGDAPSSSAGSEGAARLFPSVRQRGDLCFIGLNTACPTPPGMASGRLGDAQLTALAKLLQKNAKQFRVVHLHHCPVPGQEPRQRHLSDAHLFIKVIAQHGAELILHGHGHRTQWLTIPTPNGFAPVATVASASSCGRGHSEPATWSRYAVERTLDGWHLQQQTRRYNPAQNSFTAAETRDIKLSRS